MFERGGAAGWMAEAAAGLVALAAGQADEVVGDWHLVRFKANRHTEGW